jgi:DNA helicase HerA-like ATPase
MYVAQLCLAAVDKSAGTPSNPLPHNWQAPIVDRVIQAAAKDLPKHGASWKALIGRLGRLNRMRIFDQPCPDIDYQAMLRSGHVSIIDLSDLDNYNLKNLAIAELLRGIQNFQEDAYNTAQKQGKTPTPINIMIEEAHEFLSAHRISKMPIIREQVERIARRGRKRYLGLTFITQMPQHLPDEMLSLVNNWVIHKIADESVVRRLQKVVQNVDPGIWTRVPSMAPGQALVSMTHLRKALMTLIDPSPCELRMTD